MHIIYNIMILLSISFAYEFESDTIPYYNVDTKDESAESVVQIFRLMDCSKDTDILKPCVFS